MEIAVIDVGGTNIRYATGTPEGEILINPSTEEVEPDISTQVNRIIENLKIQSNNSIDSVSIVTAGPPDHKEKSVKRLKTLKHGIVTEVEFGKEISNQGFDFDNIYLENDVNAAALGEYYFGVGANRGITNLVYLTFSTGIGAGAIQEGKMHRGHTGNAGKVGAYPLAPEYGTVTTETIGCWDDLCSGKGIPNFIDYLLENETRNTSLNELDHISAENLYQTAQDGDKVAEEYVKEVIGKLNARGVGIIALTFDPEIITVGGAIAHNNPDLVLDPIRRNFPNYYVDKYGYPDIELTELGENIGLYGGLALPTIRNT